MCRERTLSKEKIAARFGIGHSQVSAIGLHRAWPYLCDIMAGASGGDNPEDADCWLTGAQILPRIARSIELRLLPKDYKERMAYLVSIFNADEYENAKKLTDILFRSGIRA